ncbi:type VII secretion integral membrane protein EccD [Mycolicibacterium peregrinum]|uniref:type VII secretion integral membrane protein EccD n=1 Tax=Mycolicibacterium peregrinum TaxID=43304 RepID=UPI000B4BE74B|nr:type VII secretion integral membrane protein EccD [Mycolicibacterium peregrinum]OWM07848.1 type VII secretion integral membrane protein EccD [Mycolicibacterium peregrinum]
MTSSITALTTNISLITGTKTTDVTVQSEVPIKEWIADVVDFVSSVHRGADIGFDFDGDNVWTLAPVGAPPIERAHNLNSAGIVDGALVQLVSVSHTERYRPLVEDVIDGVAVLNPNTAFNRADVTKWVNGLIPVVGAGVAAAAVVGWSANPGQRLWWGPAVLVLAVALGAAGMHLWRRYDQVHTAESLFVAATILAATGAALTVPLSRDATWLGAPNLAGAGFALFACALFLRGGPLRRHTVTTTVATGGLVATLIALSMGYGWHQWIWPAVIALGLFLITSAAKLTVLFARFTLPPIPAAGEPVDVDDLLDPVIDSAAEAANDPGRQSWRAVLESVPSSSARLVERSALAQQLLTGFVWVGSATLALGAVMTFQPGHFLWHSSIVAALCAVTSALRSRFYANRRCAWALLTASAAIAIGCAAKLIAWHPADTAAVTAGLLAVTTTVIVGIAATRDVKRISPITKKTLERFDGLTIAAIVPLLFWVAGVYDLVRNLVF